jgi:hypothetical protein
MKIPSSVFAVRFNLPTAIDPFSRSPGHLFPTSFLPQKKHTQSSPRSRNKNYGEDCVSRAARQRLTVIFFGQAQSSPNQSSPELVFAAAKTERNTM